MENFQIRKSLRFKLESNENNNLIEDKIDNICNSNDFDLEDFFSLLDDFLKDLGKYLRYKDKNGEFAVKGNLTLKKEWMRTYAKQEFAEFCPQTQNNKKSSVQYTIKDYGVEDRIQRVLNESCEICDLLRDDTTRELNERAKRSRTAILLKRLSTKNCLPLLVDLVENIVNKKEKADDSITLKRKGKKLLEKLDQGIHNFLPEQSNGVVLTKASFNYYTINKKHIDFSKKIEEIKKRLIVQEKDFKNYFQNKIWKEDILKRANSKTLYYGELPFDENNEYAYLRQILKNILSEQKSTFNEQMQKGFSYQDLKKRKDLYLFNDITEKTFNFYKEYTKKLKELSDKKNSTNDTEEENRLTTEIDKIAKDRGALIQNSYFHAHKQFSEINKKIAQKHGREYAKLIGIEKEKAESQLLNYWAMLLEENNQHKLVLIPKENAQACYKRVKESNQQAHDAKLYWFESFTYRSLQKLCFGNPLTNTFYPNIKELVGNISGEYKFNNDQEKIKFYKDVLNTSYAKRTLSLPNKELKESVINKDFNSLDDFKIALEQVCYKRNVKINPALIKSLEEEFGAQILDITSYDLRRTNETSPNKEKAHTKIWREFWSEENKQNNFDTRLNPEISIVYRKAKESRIVKYKIDHKMNNRYLYEQLTLVTSFSQYCNSPSKNLSFLTTEKVQETINKFNENINKEKFSFALGIDNGEVELSTLGVYLPEFNDGDKESKLEKFKDVEKYGFETLTIRDLEYKENYNGKDREIKRNASYFLNEELYCRTFNKTSEQFKEMFEKVFERKHTLTLDLSTAKVINGHIVTNGDVISLYNLWLKHAQRNIYEMNDHGKKETIRNIKLIESEKLNETEKRYIVDSLNRKNNRYKDLSDDDKIKYIDWLYKFWAKKEEENEEFERVKKNQMKGNYLEDFLWAASYVGDNLEPVKEIANFEPIRHIFKFREDFVKVSPKEEIMKQIDEYNTKEDVTKKDRISNEELDLKLNQLKSSLVANAIGVIDFLYKQYKERFKGEGLIVKEFKGESDVDKMREKFSINIYRMLERKLYQKFQNYGLVPPIKNIIEIREEDKEDKFSQVGVICFVNESGTSQRCPICEKGKLNHTETCSEDCGFNSKDIMHSNDGIAGYNIAKKGFREITKK
jgi:hypothetical protein